MCGERLTEHSTTPCKRGKKPGVQDLPPKKNPQKTHTQQPTIPGCFFFLYYKLSEAVRSRRLLSGWPSMICVCLGVQENIAAAFETENGLSNKIQYLSPEQLTTKIRV